MNETTQIQPPINGHQGDIDVAAFLRGIGREDLLTDQDRTDEFDAVLTSAGIAPAPARPEPRAGRASKLTAVAFSVLLLLVEAVIAYESWGGLVGFGHLINLGSRAIGVPVTLDGVGLLAALIALRAELEGESSGMARATLAVFTLASCAANWWHGQHTGGLGAALYLGGMSVAVAWVFGLILRQLRREDRRRAKRLSDPLPKFGLAHWIRYPGLTSLALSLAIRDGHKTPREALEAAKTVRAAAGLAKLPPLPLDTATLTAMTAQARLAVAFGAIGKTDIPAALELLKARGVPIDQSHAYQVRKALLSGSEA
jgi:Protein of unknown function (DUF2637)